MNLRVKINFLQIKIKLFLLKLSR